MGKYALNQRRDADLKKKFRVHRQGRILRGRKKNLNRRKSDDLGGNNKTHGERRLEKRLVKTKK